MNQGFLFMTSPRFLVTFVLICLLISWVLRRRGSGHGRKIRQSARVLKKLASIPHPAARLNYLRAINPYVFEELLLTAFAALGNPISRNKRYSGDNGLDGRVKLDGKWTYLQAKRYRGYVKLEHIREFNQLCERSKQPGIFIHTGKTGSGVWKVCSPLVHVVSGENLVDFIDRAIVAKSGRG